MTHLCSKACASVHDESPELSAAGHTADVQAIIIALLYMLLNAGVCHIVVISLLHRPMCIVHSDPLRCWEAKPDLLLGSSQVFRFALHLLSCALVPKLQSKSAVSGPGTCESDVKYYNANSSERQTRLEDT